MEDLVCSYMSLSLLSTPTFSLTLLNHLMTNRFLCTLMEPHVNRESVVIAVVASACSVLAII